MIDNLIPKRALGIMNPLIGHLRLLFEYSAHPRVTRSSRSLNYYDYFEQSPQDKQSKVRSSNQATSAISDNKIINVFLPD